MRTDTPAAAPTPTTSVRAAVPAAPAAVGVPTRPLLSVAPGPPAPAADASARDARGAGEPAGPADTGRAAAAAGPDAPEPGGAALIVADWGTTSCRFVLVAADGTVLDRVSGRGILPVLADAAQRTAAPADEAQRASPSGEERAAIFEAELRLRVGEWLAASPAVPVLMCGMIGSNTGWVDAGYRQVPCEVVVDPGDLAPVPLDGHEARIVPGLMIGGEAPDIMRGEETQVLGALRAAGEAREHLVIAPGTHSKWVRAQVGRVTSFRSYLTGELFTALREHTIIGRGIPSEPQPREAADAEAFRAGLERARDGAASPLHTVFSARTRVVAGNLAPADVPSYLSGLLIGEEIADGLAATEAGPDTVVTVIGSADLAERYRAALAHVGITAHLADGDATLRGLLAVAEAAGWVDAGASADPPTAP